MSGTYRGDTFVPLAGSLSSPGSTFGHELTEAIPVGVRAKAGCLDYGPAIDVPSGLSAQPPVRDDVVTVVERWEDLEALKAHLAAPHMQEYRARVKDYVVRTQLQVLQPA